jgi:hypothetical protein
MPIERTDLEGSRRSNPRSRVEPRLSITDGTFSSQGLFQFANECIVPALVEDFLRSRLNLRDLVDTAHNVDQL